MSTASLRVRGVAGVAAALAAWHGWGILVTPERSFFWFMTFADLVVVATAAWLGTTWAGYADVEEGGIVLLRQRIRYDAITGIRTGQVSAKPFWLAFWIPTSLVVGAIVARTKASAFNREVLEITTANGRARLRWRDCAARDELVSAVRAARPDLEPRYGLDGRDPARDFTPKLSVGGGLLAACLVLWLFIAGWSGLQLFDRSTEEEPNSLQATTSALRSVTSGLTGYEPLSGVRTELRTRPCPRVNNFLLGPSPDVVDLYFEIAGPDVPTDTANGVEARLRKDTGMEPDEYYHPVDRPRSDVAVDIPIMSSLHVEIFTGCVRADDVPALKPLLDELAEALGVRR